MSLEFLIGFNLRRQGSKIYRLKKKKNQYIYALWKHIYMLYRKSYPVKLMFRSITTLRHLQT